MTSASAFRTLVPMAAVMLLLAGCSAEPTGTPAKEPAASTGSTAAQDPSSDAVLAEGTTDLGENGVITSVVRSITADEKVMHLRYALTRDGGDEPLSFFSLGIGHAPTVTDLANLKAYRPFCAEGSWTGDGKQKCTYTVLGSVPHYANTDLAPDATMEIGVLLPAPEGQPETVDVILGDGLPGFSAIPVTYVDDAR
ncbi:hypothetical protein ACIPV2_10220 [Microbacterium sp. NPDC089987]|uniref:hypothetical protein n=1 Tax=Microbacterium sp. NPDC089987 TaxID=3364202 RepID=UPI00381F4B46